MKKDLQPHSSNAFASPSALSSFALAAALVLTLDLAGCHGTAAAPDDAGLNSAVQNKLSGDQNLSGQSVQASVAGGIVTLNGNVTSDTARTIASEDVAQIAGVRTVVNNLVVQAPRASASIAAPLPPPVQPQKTRKPPAMISPPQFAPVVRNAPPPPPSNRQDAPAPSVAQEQAPPPPQAPPAPVAHNITLPAGTAIPVRITQTLDSATTQTGDKFTGAVASDIIVDGLVVLPQGTAVTGHVDAAQDAAHFKGSALLTISLGSIARKGERIDVATEPYTKEGEGRGKNTAEKVGGGAAVGAILGGIFGGGKGAAIGAAAGGGVGAGANGVTRGQQVQIPSETVIRFKLSDAIIVHFTTSGGSSSQELERHSDR